MSIVGLRRLAVFALAGVFFVAVKTMTSPVPSDTGDPGVTPPAVSTSEQITHSPRSPQNANTYTTVAGDMPGHNTAKTRAVSPSKIAKNVSPSLAQTLALNEDEHIFYATAIPNDPVYPQWYQTIIHAPQAWDITTGQPTTLVAVIDTGFALGHEDLQDTWYTNVYETGTTTVSDLCWDGSADNKQTNNCDDDQNGFVDDWRGWDFTVNDNNVQTATNSATGSSHGTKSAGLVAARSNNGIGTASLNWQAKILPLQALSDGGSGYSSDIAAAIEYAVHMGASVINLSLGGPDPDSATRAAVQYAHQHGVVVVASAGNCGDGQSADPCIGYPSPGGMSYPALYPEVVSVGASTSLDERASFSSYGSRLTLVAPGSGTISTPTWTSGNATSAYAATSFGTSFSAPIVSSAVSLLKGLRPNITANEAITILTNSSDKVAGMGSSKRTDQYGWGRLNVAAMLESLSSYESQLLKSEGGRLATSETYKPQISSNRGHTLTTGIISTNTVKTYCLADPFASCTLTLNKVGGGTTTIETKLLNAQGVTVFEWSKGSKSSGTYTATVTVNGIESEGEALFIK